MFSRRKRQGFPQLNTTSTADISFMLLTFFLVTTSMDTDKGLARRLPPPPQQEEAREVSINQRNVLRISIDDGDVLRCDGKVIGFGELSAAVESFVENKGNTTDKPEKHVRNIPLLGRCSVTDKHTISVKVADNASYDTYFKAQNAIVRAYNRLRERLAQSRFGHPLSQCTPEEREAVSAYYPQRISEAEPDNGGEVAHE